MGVSFLAFVPFTGGSRPNPAHLIKEFDKGVHLFRGEMSFLEKNSKNRRSVFLKMPIIL
jgi:hypothetical protein